MTAGAGRRVGVNERGWRVGEGHHRAKLSDAVVALVRDLHELQHLSSDAIATRLHLSWHTVRAIISYRRRAQVPRDWREVDAPHRRGR